MTELKDVKILFDKEITPALEEHGGGAEPLRIEGDTLFMQMYGHCVGCLQLDETVTGFIKKRVMEEFPEIKEVELEDPIAEDMYAFAKTLMGQHKP